jgi:hypothetical protein
MLQQTEQIDFSVRNRLGDLWCEFMHASPMWPIHGHYECGECGRRHPVPWAELNEAHA